jgi:hypothetical protein
VNLRIQNAERQAKRASQVLDRAKLSMRTAGAHGFLDVLGLHAIFDHTLHRGDHAGQFLFRVRCFARHHVCWRPQQECVDCTQCLPRGWSILSRQCRAQVMEFLRITFGSVLYAESGMRLATLAALDVRLVYPGFSTGSTPLPMNQQLLI